MNFRIISQSSVSTMTAMATAMQEVKEDMIKVNKNNDVEIVEAVETSIIPLPGSEPISVIEAEFVEIKNNETVLNQTANVSMSTVTSKKPQSQRLGQEYMNAMYGIMTDGDDLPKEFIDYVTNEIKAEIQPVPTEITNYIHQQLNANGYKWNPMSDKPYIPISNLPDLGETLVATPDGDYEVDLSTCIDWNDTGKAMDLSAYKLKGSTTNGISLESVVKYVDNSIAIEHFPKLKEIQDWVRSIPGHDVEFVAYNGIVVCKNIVDGELDKSFTVDILGNIMGVEPKWFPVVVPFGYENHTPLVITKESIIGFLTGAEPETMVDDIMYSIEYREAAQIVDFSSLLYLPNWEMINKSQKMRLDIITRIVSTVNSDFKNQVYSHQKTPRFTFKSLKNRTGFVLVSKTGNFIQYFGEQINEKNTVEVLFNKDSYEIKVTTP